jgi:hypothetical protein
MRAELFRTEVIENQRQSLLGHVFLAQPFSFKLITLLIAVIFVCLLVCLLLIPHTESITLDGRLVKKQDKLSAEVFSPLEYSKLFSNNKLLLLKYTDYPSEEFGTYEAHVSGEGKIIEPKDVSEKHLSENDAGSFSINSPMYLVPVKLGQDYVSAFEHKIPLSSGKHFNVDVVYKEQSYLEWLLFQ